MTHIVPSRPNAYTGSPLDRTSSQRTDAAFVAELPGSATTRFVPVWRSRSLFVSTPAGMRAAYPANVALGLHAWSYLGTFDGAPYVALDLSAEEDPLASLPDGAGEFADLRGIGAGLPSADMAILAHARGLMHWRSRNRFCGVCGAATQAHSAGNVLECTGCGMLHYPRTDPAVIMLVNDGDRVLLGHSTRFPNSTMYSTLAGFVEPGESLEEAVAREVLEETGVRVGAVRYHSSQPWPFPGSIMLGFYADATTDGITVDTEELVDARWFTRAELADPAAHGFALPRGDSIARRLIEDWMAA